MNIFVFFSFRVFVISFNFLTYKPQKKDIAIRSMGDPCATVKLSEVFSACYAEQHDDCLKVQNWVV